MESFCLIEASTTVVQCRCAILYHCSHLPLHKVQCSVSNFNSKHYLPTACTYVYMYINYISCLHAIVLILACKHYLLFMVHGWLSSYWCMLMNILYNVVE